MGEFKPINSQEELDEIIKDRLERQKKSLLEKYADYEDIKQKSASLEKELNDAKSILESSKTEKESYEKTISELGSKVRTFELSQLRTKYAMENGIPYDLASRISGEDEESIKKDAELLAAFFKNQEPMPPLRDTETGGNTEDSAYKALIKGLTGE